MQKAIIDRQGISDNAVIQGIVNNCDFDKVLLFIRQGAGDTFITDADMDDINVLMVLRTASGAEITIINSDMLELLHYTNFNGGYAMDTTDTDHTFNALVDVGRISLRVGDQIVCTVTCGNLASADTTPLISVFGIDTVDTVSPIKKYERQSVNGVFIFKRAIEIYSGTANNNATIKVNYRDKEINLNDTVANALSQCVGNYEAFVDFQVLWVDRTLRGEDVQISTPAAKTIFVVSYA